MSAANPTEYDSHDLQFYKSYPIGNFHLSKIKLICLQRIDVLLLVEKIYMKIGSGRTARQCKKVLLSELDRNNYDSFFNIINGPSKLTIQEKITSLRILDNVSHFILKTLCPPQHKKWLIIQELKLFLWKSSTFSVEEIKEFCIINNIQINGISEEEKNDLEEFIKVSNLNKSMEFYKVPFQEVLDLVAQRRVFLRSGIAFVPEKELAGLCFCYFKENLLAGYNPIILNAEDAEIARNVKDANIALIDLQLKEIFDTINNYLIMKRKYAIQVYNGPSVNELDSLLSSAYPLCMRWIHENLRKDHHLEHGARLQYILFLRSIGVSLREAMRLWKEEFTKIMSIKRFEKDHAYRLKFLYGENKAHKNYKCHSCEKIMNVELKPTERYGCPFKTLTNVALREKLIEYKFEFPDIENIIILSSSQNYQRACMKYCEATSNHLKDKSFCSPAEYFRYAYNKNNNSDDLF
ncbi:PREDICTED: DNA primase large subunit-like [Polistes dominula]|uniref:DNA primase large subunit-like n=1 Tax=Polistes dominula TaxID=743375 RepID=A0ABM1IFV3_POLDO|nr:PREDICTED: DNA primase large subunit-like [Polistes dominula]